MNKIYILVWLLLLIYPNVYTFGQVDKPKTAKDTVYLYEEQIDYDTLYTTVTDTVALESPLAIQCKHGQYYTIDTNQTVKKIQTSELQTMLSPLQYSEYKKARNSYYTSMPLLTLAGGSLIIAGIGLVQYFANFVAAVKNSDAMLDNDRYSQAIAICSLNGLLWVGAGMGATAIFAAPGIILLLKGNHHLKNIADDYNNHHNISYFPDTKLSFGFTHQGIGLSLNF